MKKVLFFESIETVNDFILKNIVNLSNAQRACPNDYIAFEFSCQNNRDKELLFMKKIKLNSHQIF